MRNKKGQALLEVAIALPILLFFFCGIVDFGRILFTQNNLNMVSQESARMAALGKKDADIRNYALSKINVSDKSTIKVVPVPDDATRKSGDYVTVTISCDLKYITPFVDTLFNGPFKAKVQSTIRVE